jgi:hypothetical protein
MKEQSLEELELATLGLDRKSLDKKNKNLINNIQKIYDETILEEKNFFKEKSINSFILKVNQYIFEMDNPEEEFEKNLPDGEHKKLLLQTIAEFKNDMYNYMQSLNKAPSRNISDNISKAVSKLYLKSLVLLSMICQSFKMTKASKKISDKLEYLEHILRKSDSEIKLIDDISNLKSILQKFNNSIEQSVVRISRAKKRDELSKIKSPELIEKTLKTENMQEMSDHIQDIYKNSKNASEFKKNILNIILGNNPNEFLKKFDQKSQKKIKTIFDNFSKNIQLLSDDVYNSKNKGLGESKINASNEIITLSSFYLAKFVNEATSISLEHNIFDNPVVQFAHRVSGNELKTNKLSQVSNADRIEETIKKFATELDEAIKKSKSKKAISSKGTDKNSQQKDTQEATKKQHRRNTTEPTENNRSKEKKKPTRRTTEPTKNVRSNEKKKPTHRTTDPTENNRQKTRAKKRSLQR